MRKLMFTFITIFIVTSCVIQKTEEVQQIQTQVEKHPATSLTVGMTLNQVTSTIGLYKGLILSYYEEGKHIEVYKFHTNNYIFALEFLDDYLTVYNNFDHEASEYRTITTDILDLLPLKGTPLLYDNSYYTLLPKGNQIFTGMNFSDIRQILGYPVKSYRTDYSEFLYMEVYEYNINGVRFLFELWNDCLRYCIELEPEIEYYYTAPDKAASYFPNMGLTVLTIYNDYYNDYHYNDNYYIEENYYIDNSYNNNIINRWDDDIYRPSKPTKPSKPSKPEQPSKPSREGSNYRESNASSGRTISQPTISISSGRGSGSVSYVSNNVDRSSADRGSSSGGGSGIVSSSNGRPLTSSGRSSGTASTNNITSSVSSGRSSGTASSYSTSSVSSGRSESNRQREEQERQEQNRRDEESRRQREEQARQEQNRRDEESRRQREEQERVSSSSTSSGRSSGNSSSIGRSSAGGRSR